MEVSHLVALHECWSGCYFYVVARSKCDCIVSVDHHDYASTDERVSDLVWFDMRTLSATIPNLSELHKTEAFIVRMKNVF